MKKAKAVFFDRDGVINDVIIESDGYVRSPRLFAEFRIRDGAREALEKTREAGYLNIIVTSQPEIKRGLVDATSVEAMHAKLGDELAIDDIFVCLHDDGDNCKCRKPKPGMLLDAADKWDIDITKSFMVGDTERDVGAGKAAGCPTILVAADYNKEVEADKRIKNISELPDFIL